MIKIDLTDSNDFVQTVVVDSVTYRLHFSWNSYAQQWFMDLIGSDSTVVLRGIRVVPNFPLLSQYGRNIRGTDVRGEFMAVVANPKNLTTQNITRKGFVDGTFSFVYIPRAELDVILSADV